MCIWFKRRWNVSIMMFNFVYYFPFIYIVLLYSSLCILTIIYPRVLMCDFCASRNEQQGEYLEFWSASILILYYRGFNYTHSIIRYYIHTCIHNYWHLTLAKMADGSRVRSTSSQWSISYTYNKYLW